MHQRPAQRSDWKCQPMPKQHTQFTLERTFADDELASLRLGLVPRDMDDRWFVFQEENCVYLHRSWTGDCIFILHLDAANQRHTVTVNADPKQFKRTEPEEAEMLLTGVLQNLVFRR